LITKITGKLVRLAKADAEIQVGAFDYQVYIPDFVRRQLQNRIGEEISLRTIEYLEGNPQHGKLTPRLIGFMNDAEREFFDLVCSVDGVGVKKALRAMVRPVREVATAIETADMESLVALPGVGPAVADRIVAKLKRKMPKFALMVDQESGHKPFEPDYIRDAYDALVLLGHSSNDARKKMEAVTSGKKKFKSVEDILNAIYKQEQI